MPFINVGLYSLRIRRYWRPQHSGDIRLVNPFLEQSQQAVSLVVARWWAV